MLTVGPQEMIVIFLVALVLFGPKKLPELGKTIGKALTEFRRASNDLKATFEREMHNLERETDSFKQVADSTANTIHQQFAQYDPFADQEGAVTPSHEPATVSASEVASAESHGTESTTTAVATEAEPVSAEKAIEHPHVEGTVARVDSGSHSS
jgi:TatA/E family protein of Tat protein translocase